MSKVIKPEGSVLAAQNALAATVLSPELTVLKNVPRHRSVTEFIEILTFLGATVTREESELTVNASNLNISAVPVKMAQQTPRAVILVGSLLARLQKAAWPSPPAQVAQVLTLLEPKVSQQEEYTVFEGQPGGGRVALEERSDLSTLAVVFTAVSADQETIIAEAALDPEVSDTLELLEKMGVSIECGSDAMVIQPTDLSNLEFAEHKIINDRHQAVREICVALSQGEEAKVEGVNSKHLTAFLSKLDAAKINYKVTDNTLNVWIEDSSKLQSVELDPKPYPGFEKQWLDSFVTMLGSYGK